MRSAQELCDCLIEMIELLSLFQREVYIAWEEATYEILDAIQLSIQLEELVGDIDEIMIEYLGLEGASNDLSFEYSNFVGIWLEIITVFCGNTPQWRANHSILFRQLGYRITSLIANFEKELREKQK